MASRGRSNFSGRVRKFRRADFDEDEAPEGGIEGKESAFGFDNDDGLGDDEAAAEATLKRFANVEAVNALDEQMGFVHYAAGPSRLGWMLNMRSTFVKDPEWPGGRSAVDYYFLEEDGSYFRSTVIVSPYFLVRCKSGTETLVEDFLRRRFENLIEQMQRLGKEDLELPNHLSGRKGRFLKLSFRNTVDLLAVRRVLQPAAQRNAELAKERGFLLEDAADGSSSFKRGNQRSNPDSYGLNNIVDLREHDIPYHLRVNIDLGIRVGLWYTVSAGAASRMRIERVPDKNVRPDPVVLAFDIETSKLPLKFPDAQNDPIMMISYMIDGKGYLVTNRNIVSKDLESFEYTPKPEYQGHFTVFSEADEKAMLLRFFAHIQLVRPAIYVTYNGDSFDWPFIDERCKLLGIDMKEQCGVEKNAAGEYGSSCSSHMDCFRWVKRDSYLPAGSQGLKAVTAAKLGYNPLELDPEEMTDLARVDPQTLASYSVSDAVATYYLYMKYVNPFIFSLCNIIPLTPDEVLRKGSGTLCETLLMAEAFKANIVMPNKHTDPKERFYNGHLIESETYIGGHVEALESGVFRSDIPCKFKMVPKALEQLIRDLDRALKFCLEKEGGVKDLSEVLNYDEVKSAIEAKLQEMLANPNRLEGPLIYHLDVAAMYPNIILTNRLQPPAIVDESMCALCDFNKPGKTCQRKMTWSWRGEFYTAKRSEYRMIKNQLESERFPSPYNPQKTLPFLDLPGNEQHRLLTKRLAEYSQKVYKRTRSNEVVQKTSIVCQRENSFYVDTVRNFRDRRYDYKALHKQSKKRLDEAVAASDAVAIEEWSKMHTLYDSLQVAHKCILNSFYGYVMRKGARWYSMEMAGIVCETGGAIIRLARQLVEQIGRPLELDTDGIWCMLPATFPENFTFNLAGGKKHGFAYPCVMLNHLVHDQFTNEQYQTLTDPAARKYAVSRENSIFFEIDGPYRAMILPSSTEEGKLLKKRYAVFADDGKLAELKGFEIKRRGELKMIKIFQSQLFKTFLDGDSLVSCYAAVAKVADYWLDILHTKGAHLTDQELFELISENRSMSKSLEDYGNQKSTSISTAKRLAEFLGDEMVKDKGLACRFIISLKPVGDPVASRAIPVAIFSAEPEVKRHYLRKWCRDPGMTDFNIRSLLDWQYYLERLESVVQKLILIPAAMQHVPNPVPRVTSPDWIRRYVERMSISSGSATSGSSVAVSKKQLKMTELFEKKPASDATDAVEIEEMASVPQKRVRFAESVVDNEKPASAVATDLPKIDITINYRAWVASRKARWRQLRKSLSEPSTETSGASASLFAWSATRTKDAIVNGVWDVLYVEEEDADPGTFSMSYMVHGTARRVRFRRSRKIYVHCREAIKFPEGSASLPLVHFKLPYPTDMAGNVSASTKIIYEITTDEGDYMANYQQYASFMCHPNVVGIYEATMPLSFLNTLQLGSKIQLAPEIRKLRDPLNPALVFSSSDFVANRVEGGSAAYLDASSHRILFVYHLHTDSRHIFFMYCSRGISIASVVIVDPAGKRHLPNLKALFSTCVTSGRTDETGSSPFEYAIVPEFEVDVVADMDSAARLLRSKTTSHLQTRGDGPLIGLLVTSARKDASSWCQIAAAFSSVDASDPVLPMIPCPSLLEDACYLPPLDWQRHGLRCAFDQFSRINAWWTESVRLARYAQIPIGNLPLEGPARYSAIADVFLGRELKAKGFLLPHRLDGEFGGSTTKMEGLTDTSALGFEVERSGAFENVVYDLGISGFALNALLQYNVILGPEVSESMVTWTGGMLPVLRALVRGWFLGALDAEAHALKLTEGFYRWLLPETSSASSMLLGSGRCHVFEALQVVNRRALGLLAGMTAALTASPPILLNDARLVMVTRCRLSMASAQAFVDYFTSQVSQREEFQFLQFWTRARWTLLLWMDRRNWAGIPALQCEDTEEDEETQMSRIAESMKAPVEMDWTLKSHLPPLYEKPFLTLVGRLVRELFKQACCDSDAGNADAAVGDEDSNVADAASLPHTFLDGTAGEPDEDDDEALKHKTSRRSIPFEFSQMILRVVQELSKLVGVPLNESDRLLKLCPASPFAAAHNDARFYLIEFVKYVGTIFSLHPVLASSAVPSMLKQVFALLSVREFADETIFSSPIGTLSLRNLACGACGYVQSVELAGGNGRVSEMNCLNSACNEPFDPIDLEESLLTTLQAQLLAYQRQDLQCLGCGLPTPSALSKTCPSCPNAPKLKFSRGPESVRSMLRLASQVAQLNKMATVQHFISSLNN